MLQAAHIIPLISRVDRRVIQPRKKSRNNPFAVLKGPGTRRHLCAAVRGAKEREREGEQPGRLISPGYIPHALGLVGPPVERGLTAPGPTQK